MKATLLYVFFYTVTFLRQFFFSTTQTEGETSSKTDNENENVQESFEETPEQKESKY